MVMMKPLSMSLDPPVLYNSTHGGGRYTTTSVRYHESNLQLPQPGLPNSPGGLDLLRSLDSALACRSGSFKGLVVIKPTGKFDSNKLHTVMRELALCRHPEEDNGSSAMDADQTRNSRKTDESGNKRISRSMMIYYVTKLLRHSSPRDHTNQRCNTFVIPPYITYLSRGHFSFIMQITPSLSLEILLFVPHPRVIHRMKAQVLPHSQFWQSSKSHSGPN